MANINTIDILKTKARRILKNIRYTILWQWRITNLALRFQNLWFSGTKKNEIQAMQLLEDLDGTLTQTELRWLYRKVMELPNDALIVEINPGSGQITCCLALGCRATRRHVQTIWPTAACNYSSQVGLSFTSWHQNIIRKYLIPYVTPLVTVQDVPTISLKPVSMIYMGNDPMFQYTQIDLKDICQIYQLQNALIVQPANSTLPKPQKKQSIGNLIFGYNNKSVEGISN